jgi:hypothetical protein
MFNKINRYLLTHYPLLWNTRFVWIIAANLVLHFFFFLGGFSSVTTSRISAYGHPFEVGGGNMITFSILCSILSLTLWLVFYLRNNAFKIFYRIDRWHLARETLLILVIIFTSINYFHSFIYGVRVKVRTITSISDFVNEVNLANRASVFIPTDSKNYFILNNCQGRKEFPVPFSIRMDENSNRYSGEKNYLLIRDAMVKPDAFSYKNYCDQEYSGYEYAGIFEAPLISSLNNNWIDNNRRDSVEKSIQELISLCRRYGIDLSLPPDSLTALVFQSPYHTISWLVPGQQYDYSSNTESHINPFYFDSYDLSRTFDFIYDCLPNSVSLNDQVESLLLQAYVALFLSVLVLCYRRFTRKVFLISLIGSIVWAIITGLIAAMSNGNEDTILYWSIFLCLGFGILGLLILSISESKTFTGILFTWHAVLVPFVLLFVMSIISNYFVRRHGYERPLKEVALENPFSYWVWSHTQLITIINLFLIIIYFTFLFNKWTRMWIEKAEE